MDHQQEIAQILAESHAQFASAAGKHAEFVKPSVTQSQQVRPLPISRLFHWLVFIGLPKVDPPPTFSVKIFIKKIFGG